jgi:hypothetical protein
MLLLALLLTGSTASAADISVRYVGGQLELKARAPLGDVLEAVGAETGMKVVFEGVRPRQVVYADLQGVSAAQAVRQLLEGENVAYAARTSDQGRRVDLLVLVGGDKNPGGSARASAAPSEQDAMTASPPLPGSEEAVVVEEPVSTALDAATLPGLMAEGASPGAASSMTAGPQATAGPMPAPVPMEAATEAGFPAFEPPSEATGPVPSMFTPPPPEPEVQEGEVPAPSTTGQPIRPRRPGEAWPPPKE